MNNNNLGKRVSSKRKKMYLAVILLLVLAILVFIATKNQEKDPQFLSVSSGTNIYIDRNLSSNCNGNYSIASRNCNGADGRAYTTLAGGIGAAVAGDTINIRAGVYTITDEIKVEFKSDNQTTTIKAYNSENVTIKTPFVARPIFKISTGKNILIKDLHFEGTLTRLVTGWTNHSGNVWKASIPEKINEVMFNGSRGSQVGTAELVVKEKDFYVPSAGTELYIYSVGNPSTVYTNPGIELQDKFAGIAIGGTGGVSGNLITVDNCVFEKIAHVALKGKFRWHVKNSKFYNNGADVNDHHIYATGVQTAGNEMIFENNYFGYTPGAALHIFASPLPSPSRAIVRNNIFSGLSAGGSRGFWGVLLAGTNHEVHHNTFYGLRNGVMFFRGTTQNNLVRDNIFFNTDLDLVTDSGGGGGSPSNNTAVRNYLSGNESKCRNCGVDPTLNGNTPPNYANSTSALPFVGSLPLTEVDDFKIKPSHADANVLADIGAFGANSNQPIGGDNEGGGGNDNGGGNQNTTPPTTTDNATSGTKTTDVTVTLTCTGANGTACANTYYTTNGSNPTTNSSRGTVITLTQNGTYTIKYFSIDTLGNRENVKTSTSFTINKAVAGGGNNGGGDNNSGSNNNGGGGNEVPDKSGGGNGARPETGSPIVCGSIDVAPQNGIRDNKIGLIDFSSFVQKYGRACSDRGVNHGLCGGADSNDDGVINIVDFANFASKFNKSCT